MKPCVKCNMALNDNDEKCWSCGAAQPTAPVLDPQTGERKCPYCAEWIKPEATVCRYCGKSLLPQKQNSLGCGWAFLAFLIPVVGFIVGLVYMGQEENKERGKGMVVISVITFIIGFIFIMASYSR